MGLEKDLGAVSAYAIAIAHGFEGTEEEWLESLIGPMGYQGWSVSAVRATTTGQLIFTVTDPKTGEIRELDPVQGDTIDALKEIEDAAEDAKNQVKEAANAASASAVKAVEGAQNAGVQAVKDTETAAVEAVTSAQTAGVQAVQGAQTAAINAVSEAQTQATEAIEASENQALQDISNAKTSAMSDINATGENAVNSVNSAGQAAVENAQTAITTAKNQAVSDVQAAGQSAVDAVKEAQTAGVQAVEDAQADAVKAVQDAGTALDTTWSSECIVSRLCLPFTTEGSIVTCQPVEGSRLNTVVQIEPVQEGEGDSTPDNVRPIKGWDVVTLCHCGKNLLSFTGEIVIPKDTYALSSPRYYPYLVQAMEKLPRNFPLYIDAEFSYFVENGAYKQISTSQDNQRIITDFCRGDARSIPSGPIQTVYVYAGKTKTEDCVVSNMRAGIHLDEYQPYRGETFTIQLGQAVYGGTLNVTTGVLTRTHANIPSYAGEDVGDDWISSTGSLTDGAQVVYRLPQPEIIQLDPVKIIAISNENTIYADAGDVTVSGYSDPNAVITALADRIAALEQNAIGG